MKTGSTDTEKTTQSFNDLKVEDDGTSDRKLLIAVDFGTTFSGVAWAQTRRVSCFGERFLGRRYDAKWVAA